MAHMEMETQLIKTGEGYSYIHVIGEDDIKEIAIFFLVDAGKLHFSSATEYFFAEDKEIAWEDNEEAEFKSSFPHLLENVKEEIYKDDELVKDAGLHINSNTNKENNIMTQSNTTATINNASVKENNMNTANISTGKKTEGQYIVTSIQDGLRGVIPVIDGVPYPECMMGYVSESDKEAGLKALHDALIATNGDVHKAMWYMYNAVKTSANGIQPDEILDCDGTEVIIDYNQRAAYLSGNKLVDLSDISDELSHDTIKYLLKERVKNFIKEVWENGHHLTEEELDELMDDDCDDYDDEDYDDEDEEEDYEEAPQDPEWNYYINLSINQ